ncbi:hypothetical protein MMC11_000585 [Xylographa trunciseda]|nr:hypothetical protein [Xylographa trunciseda]
MSSSVFSITKHIIPCQHIRGYPRSAKDDTAVLNLAVTEYRPLDNLQAAPGSVTLIATHANGLPKEAYEPLWDDLYRSLEGKIRAIWFADCSHQGTSGVLNEKLQGDDPNWFDHSRDLLHMVNHFRERMLRPIIGVGHSMGAAQLIHLSLLHERLFHSLVLFEPIIQENGPAGVNVALPTSYRPDLWSSRSQAEASMRKNKFFQSWDSRALARYFRYGLRETPTAIYPSATDSGAVTLTTTKHQEAWSYLRPNFSPMPVDPSARTEQWISPDLDVESRTHIFHRPEMVLAFRNLPFVRPSVLWVYGAQSYINTPVIRQEKLALTGTGVGGSGGALSRRVEEVVVEEASHMLPFEKVQDCASVLARWLERMIDDFKAEEKFHRQYDSGKSERDMLVLSKLWLQNVRRKENETRTIKGKL